MSEAEVSQLPVRTLPQAPRHVFGVPHFIAQDPARGRPYPQTERSCPCGVVKVTVHGKDGAAWREWRLPNCKPQFSDALGAPPCTLSGSAP
jgi:hypothetical protein